MPRARTTAARLPAARRLQLGSRIQQARRSAGDADRVPAVDRELVRPAQLPRQARIVHSKVLLRVIEDVVASVAARAPEDHLEARPPQLMTVVSFVDHHRADLVLRAERVTGLDQRLGGLDFPELLVVSVPSLP